MNGILRGQKKARILYAVAALLSLLFAGFTPLTAAETKKTVSVKVISGDEIILGKDSNVRLEGIMAPLPQTQEFAEQARAALERLTTGKTLALENVSTDRYGRTSAQLFIIDDHGVRMRLQEELLREGLAFVYPPTGQEPGLDSLLTAENEARAQKRGIWADEFYVDTPADKAWNDYGRFAFVRGTVVKAERIRNKIYLHFGNNRKKDFTVEIAARDLIAFRKAGIEPLAYEGKIVCVRGWVARDYGPMIAVTAPGQIEISG